MGLTLITLLLANKAITRLVLHNLTSQSLFKMTAFSRIVGREQDMAFRQRIQVHQWETFYSHGTALALICCHGIGFIDESHHEQFLHCFSEYCINWLCSFHSISSSSSKSGSSFKPDGKISSVLKQTRRLQ